MSRLTISPAFQMSGAYTPPSDKSISHRVAMLGALAEGQSEFKYFLEAEDCLGTVNAFKEMGIEARISDGVLIIKGKGLRGLLKPKKDLYLGNSGTTTRLLLGILSGQDFEARLTGDPSLSKRPMKRVTVPLRKMGARISGRDDANYAPLVIHGGKLTGIHWKSEIASAQVKSAILLAGLFAEGVTEVEEPELSRDHTERLFELFGVQVARSAGKVSVRKVDRLKPVQFEVPGDISSAAFLLTGAALFPGSDLLIQRVGLNPTRTGVLEVLKQMGADIKIEMTSRGPEPYGNIRVRGKRLKGTVIGGKLIPSLIDELPVLMIACALAEGESIIRDAAELRVKETDRISSMLAGLRTVGAEVEERPDGCVIQGVKKFKGGNVQSFGDHRTVMSFAIAGLLSEKGVSIDDTDCIHTSYPCFESDLKQYARL